MKSEYYSNFSGIDQTTNRPDAPQNSFLKLDNILVNETTGELMLRGGSYIWEAFGANLGMFGYNQDSSSFFTSSVAHTYRHRRDGSTSYIERLNYTTSAWDALTLGANTSFSAGGIAKAAQHTNILAICAGRPAYISAYNSTVNRLGGPAPTAAPTLGVSGTGLTGFTRAFYTFYNSTTGWESSPGPEAEITLTNDQLDWSALETTVAKEGVDYKRLYRTELLTDGAGTFKLVAQIALATTTYADTKTDAQLGIDAPAVGDHEPPPSTSFLCITFANKIWIASGNELWGSRTYDPVTWGANGGLEYFSYDRVRRFPGRITGLAYTPEFGRLLVFQPPGQGVHYLSGRSDSTFEQDIFNGEEGTNYPPSVSAHADKSVFWGSRGSTMIDPRGVCTPVGQGLDLSSVLETEFNSSVYISSAYVPYPVGRFVFSVCATSSDGAEWEDTVTGLSVEWQTTSGTLVEWEES